MTDPSGGFYSTQDADSEGEEGKFYVWTPSRAARRLLGDDAPIAGQYWGVSDARQLRGQQHPARRTAAGGCRHVAGNLDRRGAGKPLGRRARRSTRRGQARLAGQRRQGAGGVEWLDAARLRRGGPRSSTARTTAHAAANECRLRHARAAGGWAAAARLAQRPGASSTPIWRTRPRSPTPCSPLRGDRRRDSLHTRPRARRDDDRALLG